MIDRSEIGLGLCCCCLAVYLKPDAPGAEIPYLVRLRGDGVQVPANASRDFMGT